MVVNVIKLYLVCPATTANAKKSFSQLRRLDLFLSTMNQRCLYALLIFSNYHEELDSLNIDELVKVLVTAINFIEISYS